MTALACGYQNIYGRFPVAICCENTISHSWKIRDIITSDSLNRKVNLWNKDVILAFNTTVLYHCSKVK